MRPAVLAALPLMLVAALPASAVTLYDPGLGSLPSAQGWTTAWNGTAASQSLVDGLLQVDTTGAGVQAFGSGRTVLPALDTVAGFQLRWQMQVVSEQHSSDNRAGFSVLMQGADQTQSLELGFWEDKVWALGYQAGSGFLRTETASLDATVALRQYTLTVQQGSFSLLVDGERMLSGALRDYPTLGFATYPYSLNSYLFMGDNSSSGQSVVRLGEVSLQPVPEPTTLALWAAGLGFGVWRLRRNGQA